MENSFYESLYTNDTFTSALGRFALTSAKLETSIKAFIDAKGITKVDERTPLGGLIKVLLEKHEIDKTAGEQLKFVLEQRNYFIHRLYFNLTDYPEDSYQLQRFTNRIISLTEEMEFFSKLLIDHS